MSDNPAGASPEASETQDPLAYKGAAPRVHAITLTKRGASGLLTDYYNLACELERDLAAARAELAENEGVIAVWRRRATEAEAERDALYERSNKGAILCRSCDLYVIETHELRADVVRLREALQEIVRNDPYNQSSAGIVARAALAAKETTK